MPTRKSSAKNGVLRGTSWSWITALLLAVSLRNAYAPAWADRWGAPTPRVFASEAGRFGFVAVPEQNEAGAAGKVPSGTSFGTLFRLDAQGQQVTVWKRSLINVPMTVLVSDLGDVVTLDTYARPGREHALVVYGPAGQVLADYRLEQLLTPQEIATVPHSMSGRFWTRGRVFRFTHYGDAPHLVIRPEHGRVVRVNLQTGKLKPPQP